MYEKAEMQRRVRELFWGISLGSLGREDKGAGAPAAAGANAGSGSAAGAGPAGEQGPFRQEEEDLMLVDASPSVEEVAEEIWKKVLPRVEAVDRGEVGRTVRIVS